MNGCDADPAQVAADDRYLDQIAAGDVPADPDWLTARLAAWVKETRR